MTEAQFRQHWIGKVFRADTPSGPKIVYSGADGRRAGEPHAGRDRLRRELGRREGREGAEDRRTLAGAAGYRLR